MNKPEMPQKDPYCLELEPGDYWWCACGKSKNQPFCDGSHEGTGFAPVKFTQQGWRSVCLCGCKQTKDAPHCDGTHNELD